MREREEERGGKSISSVHWPFLNGFFYFLIRSLGSNNEWWLFLQMLLLKERDRTKFDEHFRSNVFVLKTFLVTLNEDVHKWRHRIKKVRDGVIVAFFSGVI